MSKHYLINLENFISEEREYLLSLNTFITWEDSLWDCANWIFYRGASHKVNFNELPSEGRRKTADPIPLPFSDFCKALVVFIYRTKKVGLPSVQQYAIECRRIYGLMKLRNESSVHQLTRWHFEEIVKQLQENNYKNLYAGATTIQVISKIIDDKDLTEQPICFKHCIPEVLSRNTYIPIADLGSDKSRKMDEKLPSYEAMKAYSICTNNPLSDDEEIILRTIDLLIVMGQRGNEVALIPFECWVEERATSGRDQKIQDANGKEIIKYGIRYYAEKKFKSTVHWLADQDVPFARRAVERLKLLTEEARKIAKWQEESGRIWELDPENVLEDSELLNYLYYTSFQSMHVFFRRRNVDPVRIIKGDFGRQNWNGSNYPNKYFYRAGDIENAFKKMQYKTLTQLTHTQLREKINGKWVTLLTTSQLLSIKFEGAFAPSRPNQKNRLLPRRVYLSDINHALGGFKNIESIFERRNLVEADGSKIKITSHQPRHWRNTIYQLAGMTNVQQALALGRSNLNQNATYQHTSILDRTESHQNFLAFNSINEKIAYLHDSIRERKLIGEITNVYHNLLENNTKQEAESFLKIHATAIHITPFGGCTHDFSQAPCPKHLQCFNGCSHLHRTNSTGESEKIAEQIEVSKLALEKMKKESDGEYGIDVWIKDLQTKIENMQKALDIRPDDKAVKVFTNGKPITQDVSKRKGSSVSDK